MSQTTRSTTTFALGGDLVVQRLGFGAMRITGPGVWGEPADREQCRVVVRRAVELGVNLIDTADSYGPAVSEEIIHEALRPYPAGLVIATKGGLTRGGPGQWTPDCRPERLKECCDASLRRLGLEQIDLYQLHAPDAGVPYEESIGALADLQQAGKIRHIGVSNVSIELLKLARSSVHVVSVQNRYNLADRESEAMLDYCEQEGIGFIPWFPLAAGQLAEGTGEVALVAAEHGAAPTQIALAWLLRRSPVMMPIPGTSSIAHLEQNIASAQIELTDEQFDRIDRASS